MKFINLLLFFSIAFLSACAQYFPDKEKDYVHSKKIATLEMPPHLLIEPSQTSEQSALEKKAVVPVNNIEFVVDNEISYLRMNSIYAYVWRAVGRALTERTIEITDKNRASAIYYVQFDSDAQEVKDGSFWDEFVFFFGDDPNQEIPYQVYLQKTELGVSVFVRDEQGKNFSEGDGLHLLKLLFETMKNNLENK